MKKYCKDKARYPNIYEKIKKEAEYDKDYADDTKRYLILCSEMFSSREKTEGTPRVS